MRETRKRQLRQTTALLELVAQSEADLAAGRVVSQDEAFARAERVIETYCTYPNDRSPSKSC